MTGRISGIVALLVALALTSCSGKGNPTAPNGSNNGKAGQDFLQSDVFSVFSDSNVKYNDVDTAVLLDQDGDIPETVDGYTWTAFVTLSAGTDDLNLYRPFCRWVSNGPLDSTISTVPVEINTDGDVDDKSCRFVKCSAKVTDDEQVNLTVCYQIQGDNGTWDIGVTNLSWELGDFPDETPVQNPYYWSTGGRDECWPDVAWNPYYDSEDDCYLVYSSSDPADPNTTIEMYYKRGVYDGDGEISFNGPYLIKDYTTASPPKIWESHNHILPRIDIGTISTLNPSGTYVAIAYTSQFCKMWGQQHNGFHPHLVYWNEALVDGEKNLGLGLQVRCLRNPYGKDGSGKYPGQDPQHPPASTWWSDAGMQTIDIEPGGLGNGVITFAQVEGGNQYGPTLGIWECTSVISLSPQSIPFKRVTDDDDQGSYPSALYPSIACHLHTCAGMRYASITYLRQLPCSDIMYPWVAQVNLSTGEIVFSDAIGGLGSNIEVSGDYNPVQVQFLNPGASSAITAVEDISGKLSRNRYWAAWCERTEMKPPPSTVWAAWGYAGSPD